MELGSARSVRRPVLAERAGRGVASYPGPGHLGVRRADAAAERGLDVPGLCVRVGTGTAGDGISRPAGAVDGVRPGVGFGEERWRRRGTRPVAHLPLPASKGGWGARPCRKPVLGELGGGGGAWIESCPGNVEADERTVHPVVVARTTAREAMHGHARKGLVAAGSDDRLGVMVGIEGRLAAGRRVVTAESSPRTSFRSRPEIPLGGPARNAALRACQFHPSPFRLEWPGRKSLMTRLSRRVVPRRARNQGTPGLSSCRRGSE